MTTKVKLTFDNAGDSAKVKFLDANEATYSTVATDLNFGTGNDVHTNVLVTDELGSGVVDIEGRVIRHTTDPDHGLGTGGEAAGIDGDYLSIAQWDCTGHDSTSDTDLPTDKYYKLEVVPDATKNLDGLYIDVNPFYFGKTQTDPKFSLTADTGVHERGISSGTDYYIYALASDPAKLQFTDDPADAAITTSLLSVLTAGDGGTDETLKRVALAATTNESNVNGMEIGYYDGGWVSLQNDPKFKATIAAENVIVKFQFGVDVTSVETVGFSISITDNHDNPNSTSSALMITMGIGELSE